MSLLDAVKAVGPMPPDDAKAPVKKRYSEQLSAALAVEVAEGLGTVGFPGCVPVRGGAGEKTFHGGLGPKQVDVSYSDEQHGLMLAVSIKTIGCPPYGKNLTNRFYDLCPEAISLHMRFPYAVVCALFGLPLGANEDLTPRRKVTTFRRGMKLLSTISERGDHAGPPEKFENTTMILYQPVTDGGEEPWLKLIDTTTGNELSEEEYFLLLRRLFDERNPHMTEEEGDWQE